MDEDLILPIKSEIEPQFERQVQNFFADAHLKMPSVNEAELLRAAAGRREDHRLVAEYVIGMVWLSWRFDRAIQLLDSAMAVAPGHISSTEYLNRLRKITLLKNLPLFTHPRSERQTWADLEQEARLVLYLKTGRLS